MKTVYKVVRVLNNNAFTSMFWLPNDSVHYELNVTTRPRKSKLQVCGRLFAFDTIENAKCLIESQKQLDGTFAILKCETNRCFKTLLNKQQMVRYAKHNYNSFEEVKVYFDSYKDSVSKGTLYCDSVKPIEIVL